MTKKYLLALSLIGLWARVSAQKIVDDPVQLRAHLETQSYEIDPDASAVILYDKANYYWFNGILMNKREYVIKVLKKDAIQRVSSFWANRHNNATITQFEAYTYFLENGEIVKKESSEKAKEKANKEQVTYKVEATQVNEGAIVHFTYESSFYGYMTSMDNWYFQNEYPTLYSELQTSFNQGFVYSTIQNVNAPFEKVAKEKELLDPKVQNGTFLLSGSGATPNMERWVRKNVPAYEPEPFSKHPDNYRERIKVQLRQYTNRGYVVYMMDNWQQVINGMLDNRDHFCFYEAFGTNAFLKQPIKDMTSGKPDDLSKAKAIYAFVRDSIRLTHEPFKQQTSIKQTYLNRQGDYFHMMTLLTAMLKNAGFESELLINGSKQKEELNTLYPSPLGYDAILTWVKVNGKDYFLSPQYKYLPFGTLPIHSYSGFATSIHKKTKPYYLSSNMHQEKQQVLVTLDFDTENKKTVYNLSMQLGMQASAALRQQNETDPKLFEKKISEHVKQKHGLIQDKKGIYDKDSPIRITFKIEEDWAGSETLYFNPFIFMPIDNKNPFTSTTRQNPIEFDFLEDINYTFRCQLPEGYELDDQPSSLWLNLNDNGDISLKNIVSFDKEQNVFSLNSRLQFKNAQFPAEDYLNLRDFYQQMTEANGQLVVLKKKNP